MPVTHRTLRLSQQLRIRVDQHIDDAIRRLVEAWARAWTQVEPEWESAIAVLVAASKNGKWPTAAQVARANQARRALEATFREIIDLAEFAGVTISTAAREVTAETAIWQARLIASQLPAEAGDQALLIARFSRIDEYALGAIVERTTEQIESLMRPLERAAQEAMRQALVRGIALGENPRQAAARMLRLAEQRFNGGLNRALTIARTEILDAHRSAAAAHHLEHADVLAGWAWNAKLDTRTCPSCWGMHGRIFKLEEPGPWDHQCGRCNRMPLTKSWAQLGFDVEEPPSVMPDAQDAFDALAAWEKVQIMGPVRLQALETGRLAWGMLSQLQVNRGWRPSFVPIPVGDARRRLVHPV